jgi:hypothetical protein
MVRVKWERGTMLARPKGNKHARAFAVYAVDPGGTTGWARGVFLPQNTLAATLRAHAVVAGECRGSTLDQAFELTNDILEYKDRVRKDGIRDFVIVFEGFQLRTQRVDLSPVEVIAGTRALLATEGVELTDKNFQSPSSGKSFGTTPRLKHWGLYAAGRGSPHKRDALRHLALGVERKMSGKI